MTPGPSRPRVLIVDDRPENLFAMRQILSSVEAELLEARSGNEALSLVLRHPLALILLDVQMPEMDGFEVANLLRDDPATSHIPIIFVTAISKEDQHVFRGYQAGAVDYLFKPIAPEILRAKVEAFLELHRHAALERELAEIQGAQAELARSNAELERLAEIVAHDLRAPVRRAASYAQLLRTTAGDDLSEEAAELLDGAERALLRGLHLISGLPDYARVGGEMGRLAPVSLSAVVDEVVAGLAPDLQDCGGRIDVEPLPTIEADPLQIRRVVQNLLGNAVKYRRKGVPPEIRVSAHQADERGEVSLVVEDNGIGLDPEHAAEVFQPLRRLVGASEFEGTGIGLSVVERIVRSHGGNVSATGEPGRGSTFTITLPLGPASAGTAA